MNCNEIFDKFYKENIVDFQSNDELWKRIEAIHILFTKLKRTVGQDNEIIQKLYNQMFEYIEISNKQNFIKAFELGLYFNNKSQKDEG